MTVRGRLAPSPTGALHLGNARTFLLAWLSIRAQSGVVVLRIEDLDGPRVKPETRRQLIDDLKWLGLEWDEGPDIGGRFGPYVQTERIANYKRALDRLHVADLLYPCTCSRSDIQNAASAPHAGDEGPRYPGTCRGRVDLRPGAASEDGRFPAWRFRVPDEPIEFIDGFFGPQSINVQREVGDFVVWKQSTTAAYQLAVVIDDAEMEINEVVRGADLLSSTARQHWLRTSLQIPHPTYLHVPLVTGPDGRRLAKRHGDTRVSFFRDAGFSPEQVVGLLAYWSGLREFVEPVRPAELVELFDWRAIPPEPVVTDQETALRDLQGA